MKTLKIDLTDFEKGIDSLQFLYENVRSLLFELGGMVGNEPEKIENLFNLCTILEEIQNAVDLDGKILIKAKE